MVNICHPIQVYQEPGFPAHSCAVAVIQPVRISAQRSSSGYCAFERCERQKVKNMHKLYLFRQAKVYIRGYYIKALAMFLKTRETSKF